MLVIGLLYGRSMMLFVFLRTGDKKEGLRGL